jgi:type I restriction enzyme S subunit
MIDFADIGCSKIININKYEVRKDNISERAEKAIMKLNEQKIIKKVKSLLKEYSKKTKIEKMSVRSVLKEDIETGGTPHTRNRDFWEDGTINWLKIGDMNEKYINGTEKKITEKGRKDKNLKIFDEGTILFSIFGTIGKMGILKIKTTLNQAICALIPNEDIVLADYLYLILLSERNEMIKEVKYRTQGNYNQTNLSNWEIPIIKDKTKQKEFIDEIKKFERTL